MITVRWFAKSIPCFMAIAAVAILQGCNAENFKYKSDRNTSPSTDRSSSGQSQSKTSNLETANNLVSVGAYYTFAAGQTSTASTLFAHGGCDVGRSFSNAIARDDIARSTQAYCDRLVSQRTPPTDCNAALAAAQRIAIKTTQLMNLCSVSGGGNESLAGEIINDARDYRMNLGLVNPQ